MFLRPRTIARVNNPRNEELFAGLGVDASVSATKIINAMIQEQVKAGDMMIPLLTLKAGDVEIVEVELSRSSHIVKKKIKDLSLPPGSIFIAVFGERRSSSLMERRSFSRKTRFWLSSNAPVNQPSERCCDSVIDDRNNKPVVKYPYRGRRSQHPQDLIGLS